MANELTRDELLVADGGRRPSRLRAAALVGLGGFFGTMARFLLAELIPDLADVPVGIFSINLAGAFLLGYLLTVLARYGPDTGGRRDLRLLLGTGVIGSFTSYSTLALATAGLLEAFTAWGATAYALANVLLGAAATFLGIRLGTILPGERGEHA